MNDDFDFTPTRKRRQQQSAPIHSIVLLTIVIVIGPCYGPLMRLLLGSNPGLGVIGAFFIYPILLGILGLASLLSGLAGQNDAQRGCGWWSFFLCLLWFVLFFTGVLTQWWRAIISAVAS